MQGLGGIIDSGIRLMVKDSRVSLTSAFAAFCSSLGFVNEGMVHS